MKDLIAKYKQHIQQTQLKDEAYKWQLLDEFKGRPNLEATDLLIEVKSVKFSNLVYALGLGVLHHLIKEKPEEMRTMLRGLFDENIDLTKRIKIFN